MNIEKERDYCINCISKPCSKGCPLGNNIPTIIHEKDNKKAFEILCESTVLPAICGRVCSKEKQCENNCVRGIKSEPVNIGNIETYIGDISLNQKYEIPKKIKLNIDNEQIELTSENKNKKVAIIGGGPAGLTAAAFLARVGINVTIYEKHDKLGGILTYGIPDFRLPKDTVDQTIEKILEIGNINVECNKKLGQDIKLSDMEKEYDAILLAFGANISSKMGIEGENLEGVYGANEVLEYNSNIDVENKIVAVIGGGNVAMDMARTAKRNGAKTVKIIYRRSEDQMPADKKEIEEAKKEGIEFLFQNNILKIIPKSDEKENVGKIECIKTQLIKKEKDKRLVPVNIKYSNYLLETDLVFMAIGSEVENTVVKKLNLNLNKYNKIEIDNEYRTSNRKIFACGDLIEGKATVAWAAMSGREAAKNIIRFLI